MTKDRSDLALLLHAATFAAEKHRHQRRKDAQASPYINHPLAVAEILAGEGGITDAIVLVAALLHDTVEDTETTFEELEAEFGATVRDVVAEVTDDKSLPKHARKELQVEHAPNASDRARQLKIADKLCNVRDTAEHPPTGWSEERKAEYIVWADRVVAGCRGVNPALDGLYDEAVAEARRTLGLGD